MRAFHLFPLAVLGCGAILSSPGDAATTRAATMTATMPLPSTCTIFTDGGTLDFGNQTVAGSAITAVTINKTGNIGIQCTNGTSAAIYANSLNASGTQFKLANGSARLNYTIYMDAARSIAWPQSSSGTSASQTGTGASQGFNFYGTLPAQALTLPGTYTDTLTLTVSW